MCECVCLCEWVWVCQTQCHKMASRGDAASVQIYATLVFRLLLDARLGNHVEEIESGTQTLSVNDVNFSYFSPFDVELVYFHGWVLLGQMMIAHRLLQQSRTSQWVHQGYYYWK